MRRATSVTNCRFVTRSRLRRSWVKSRLGVSRASHVAARIGLADVRCEGDEVSVNRASCVGRLQRRATGTQKSPRHREGRADAPDWIIFGVLVPATIVLTGVLLPRVKGVFAALLWSLDMRSGGRADGRYAIRRAEELDGTVTGAALPFSSRRRKLLGRRQSGGVHECSFSFRGTARGKAQKAVRD